MIIKLTGVIGWDVFADEIVRKIEEATGDITVEISSEGGFVADGIVIYNALASYDRGSIRIIINGMAMSIASYIAMAGDTVAAYDNSIFMIHNAWSGIGGDHRAMRKQADHLEAISKMMAEKYSERSGIPVEEVRAMMDAETFLYGDEIRDRGFATETIGTSKKPDRDAALATAMARFRDADSKVQPKACDDFDKTCALLDIGQMKQFENMPVNHKPQEENVDELIKRLKALEAKAQRTDEETAEMAKLRDEVNDARQKELDQLKKEKAELQRVNEINDIAAHYKASAELHAKFKSEGTSDQFVKAILDERMDNPVPNAQVGDDRNAAKHDDIITGLALRSGVAVKDPSREAMRVANMSLMEVVRDLTGERELNRRELSGLAMSTSDFPNILSGLTNKMMADSFDTADVTYRTWCQESDVPDFKTVTEVSKGAFSTLKKQVEDGEQKLLTTGEEAETWNLSTYAGQIQMTRQMLVNDDLGAFADMIMEAADAGYRTANALAYSVLTANAAMSDGVALFHATTHKNYTSTGTAITSGALGIARAMMRKQKDVNGVALNVAPSFLIVSPDKEEEAAQLLASAQLLATGSTDAKVATANTFYQSLTLVVDATLEGNAWYLAASRNTVKVGYLAGTGRTPIIEERSRSAANGLVMDVVYDLGAKATSYRGLYKNAGA